MLVRLKGMRRLLCVMVVAALAMAGCGDATDDDDGGAASGELQKLPGGGWAPVAAAGGAEAQTARAGDSATSLLYPGFRIRYEAVPGLPDLRGPESAYEARADVDRSDAERLASAFGVTGTPKRVDDHSWHVQDGARTAYVSTHSLGDWTISEAPTATSASASASSCPGAPAGAEIACDSGSASTPPPEPQIPPDLPSAAAAEKRARELLDKAGVELADDAKATISEPTTEGITVSYETKLDGTPVHGIGPSITMGSGGAVKFASGTLSTFDEVGEYPLVGTEAGVKRLEDSYGGAGEVTILGGPEAIPDDVAPQEQVQTVEGVELVLLPAYPMCPGQPVYLVPGYRFILSDGQVGPVLNAVTEEHLVASGAADRRPTGAEVEPCPGQGGGQTEPGVKPDEPVTSPPAGPGSSPPAEPAPDRPPARP